MLPAAKSGKELGLHRPQEKSKAYFLNDGQVQLGVVVHAPYPKHSRLRQEDQEFKASWAMIKKHLYTAAACVS
jgi:hypothetical protein